VLPHPTLTKLEQLRLWGMLHALNDQIRLPECQSLSFEERLGLLVDREVAERQSRRLALSLKRARLREAASPENVDFKQHRGLDRAQFMALVSCQWIKDRDNLLLTGPTGVGKTYLACALAQKACREGYSVHYTRTTRLMGDLGIARADGTYARRLAALARTDLLVLDDWGITPLTSEHRRDLLEILDDRYDQRSTVVAAQLPVEHWHDYIADPTLADAILDRLIHNAHKITLSGESRRKLRAAGSAHAKEETPTEKTRTE
jgi:DNA replication protein DnaC